MIVSKNKLRILFVLVNLQGGGAEKAILKLASALSQRGHDIHLLVLENNHVYSPDGGYTIHTLSTGRKRISKGLLGKYIAAFRLRKFYKQLTRNMQFNYCVSTLPFADEVVSLAKLPNVWFRIANTLSAEISSIEKKNPKKALRRLNRYRSIYEGCNLIAVSKGVSTDLEKNIGLRESTIKTIYNLYDFEKIRAESIEIDESIPNASYVIYVGRFSTQKRFDLLFSAWKKANLSNKLVLLTDPSEALYELIEKSGVSETVIVAGFKTNPYSWIKKAEFLVLCSDHEGLPNVLIESLICGTKIISTDCPSGPREIMTGDLQQYLVPMGDAEALAEVMTIVLESPFQLPPKFDDIYSSDKVIYEYEHLCL